MAGPEATIERACVAYAKRQGFWALKLLPSITGLPDRLVIGPDEFVWFVEFKRPGGRQSKRQLIVAIILLRFGFRVSVIDNVAAFKEQLDSFSL